MKAGEVVTALRKWHGPNGREWAFFAELRAGTGYTAYRNKRQGLYNREQRFDAWALNLWPSKNMLRRCFEIKVSRSDFLHEIKHPEKRQAGLLVSNEFYFAVPQGLVQLDEIPAEAGLVEIGEAGTLLVRKKAPYRTADDLPMAIIASIARRAAESEIRENELRRYVNP